MTLSSLWHTVYPVLIAILFFELIILVHEGGHYFAARLMKIKVNEFSVGMGPKIIQRERNGTKFTLRWILFGGYCQMEGEGEDSEDPNAFNKKSVPARLFVVVAGALMNLVLGFLLTVLIVCGSNLIGTAQVAKFEANAASAASGLQVGDTIQSIDGMRVYTATDVTTGLSRSADDTLTVVVKRDGAKKTLQVKFDTEEYDVSEISIDSNGNICYPDETGNPQSLDIKIGLVQFANPSGLEKQGNTLYKATEASGEAVYEDENTLKKSKLHQGCLEASNVQVVDEMVNLIVAQRAYELNSKAITTSDTMMQQANQLKN